MPRYTRDEIVLQALDFAHAVTITSHDAPGGVLNPNAWSLKWLQNGLDWMHRLYPFSGDIQEVPMTIQSGSTDAILTTPAQHSIYLPDDFVVDVRNGLFTTFSNTEYNLGRMDYQRFLKRKLAYQVSTSPIPLCYCVVQKRLKVLPIPTTSLPGTLHYYALPSVPAADDFVDFPDENALIEYIRIRCHESIRTPGINPGMADEYLVKQLARLRSSGLLNSPEYDDGIPLENEQVIPDYAIQNRNAWMGNYAI